MSIQKELKIKKSKIGGKYYDIEYVDELKDEKGNDLSGRIFQAYSLIKIRKESYQSQLQTLVHENVHGFAWEYSIDDPEDWVAPISNALYTFIVDNPEFIKLILDYAKKVSQRNK